MICKKCGAEIPDRAKFCPHCGTNVDDPEFNFASGESVASEEVKTPEEAKEKDAKENVSEARMKKENAPDSDFNDDFNAKMLFTLRNIEIFSSFAIWFPLFMIITRSILYRVALHLYGISYYLGDFAYSISSIVIAIFVIGSVMSVIGAVYLLIEQKSKRTVWGCVSLGAIVISCIAEVSMVNSASQATYVACGLSAIYGIDLLSRVCIQKLGMESTPDVSRDLDAYVALFKSAVEGAHEGGNADTAETIQGIPQPAGGLSTHDMSKASYFDGEGLTLFGLWLLTVLVAIVTCNIGTAWMVCKIYRWEASHTVIDGKRLKFTGTGGSLLGRWILWTLLTFLTLGIFSFFQHVALRKWEMKHTFYEDCKDTNSAVSMFDGNSFQYFGYGLLQTLITLITCFIGIPWAAHIIIQWETKHEVICGDRLRYLGSISGLFIQYIVVLLLSVITLGIYSAWGYVRINRYVLDNTHVRKQPDAIRAI